MILIIKGTDIMNLLIVLYGFGYYFSFRQSLHNFRMLNGDFRGHTLTDMYGQRNLPIHVQLFAI